MPDAELAAPPGRLAGPGAQVRARLRRLFTEQITQANEGCDFAFLAKQGRNPEVNPR